jgi:hypothetical protein
MKAEAHRSIASAGGAPCQLTDTQSNDSINRYVE